jgi:PEP-CTERM motif
MLKIARLVTRPLFVTTLLCAGTCSAASVYAVSQGPFFGTLDLSTGDFHQIGPDLAEPGSGLVPASNGALLSLGFSGNLNSINPATGVTTVVGATGLGDCNGPMAPCPPNSANFLVQFNGAYYATDVSNNLYKVNPATAAASLLGPTGIPPIPFKLEATNPDGTVNIADETLFVSGGKLYATYDAGTVDFSNGNITEVIAPALYQLDVTNGTAARIGATGFGLFMAIDSGGIIYAYSAPEGGLVTLDLATGNTTFRTSVDPSVGFISGVAPVPEPCTTALLGFGLLAGAVWGRRHHRRDVGRENGHVQP